MPGRSPVIVPVKQRTPEWIEARFDGIGASEAAASIDVSQWESRISLWARKLRLVPAPEPTLPMLIGHEIEPLIARLYTEATGVKIRRANMLRRHPQHAFMLASLDRRAGRKPIELKYSARGDDYGDPGTDEVPDEVLAQVLHQLAVTDEPAGDVAALIGSRRELQIYTVRRDPSAEAALIEQEAELWRHVETRTEPPVDGSKATREYLAARYPRQTPGETIVVGPDDDLAEAIRALGLAKRIQADATAERALREAQIKAAMGTADTLEAAGLATITHRTPKDSEHIDWKALATVYARTVDGLVASLRAHEPALSLEGVEVSTEEGLAAVHDALRSLYTTTKPGTRRFVSRFVDEQEEAA